MADITKPEKFTPTAKRLFAGGIKKSRTKTMIAVFVLTVVVFTLGSVFIVVQNQRKSSPDQSKVFTALQEEVKTLRDARKDNDALQRLLKFNADFIVQTKDQKLYIATQLAAIYKTANDDKASLHWQEVVLQNSNKPSFSDYSSLGSAYVAAGDKTNAIKYFKLALTVIDDDKTISGKASQKRFLERQINALEAQK